jgi:hypothetical protein
MIVNIFEICPRVCGYLIFAEAIMSLIALNCNLYNKT